MTRRLYLTLSLLAALIGCAGTASGAPVQELAATDPAVVGTDSAVVAADSAAAATDSPQIRRIPRRQEQERIRCG